MRFAYHSLTHLCWIVLLLPFLLSHSLSLWTIFPIVLSAFRGPGPGFPTGPGTFWCLGLTSWDPGSEGTAGGIRSHSTSSRLAVHGVISRHSDLLLSKLHDQHHSQLCTGRVLLNYWMAVYLIFHWIIGAPWEQLNGWDQTKNFKKWVSAF